MENKQIVILEDILKQFKNQAELIRDVGKKVDKIDNYLEDKNPQSQKPSHGKTDREKELEEEIFQMRQETKHFFKIKDDKIRQLEVLLALNKQKMQDLNDKYRKLLVLSTDKLHENDANEKNIEWLGLIEINQKHSLKVDLAKFKITFGQNLTNDERDFIQKWPCMPKYIKISGSFPANSAADKLVGLCTQLDYQIEHEINFEDSEIIIGLLFTENLIDHYIVLKYENYKVIGLIPKNQREFGIELESLKSDMENNIFKNIKKRTSNMESSLDCPVIKKNKTNDAIDAELAAKLQSAFIQTSVFSSSFPDEEWN